MQVKLNKTSDTQVLYGTVYSDPYADHGIAATVSEENDGNLTPFTVIVDRCAGYAGSYEQWLSVKAEELLEYARKHKLEPLF